jgi:Cd2+/Zn2+-exporting ATPase
LKKFFDLRVALTAGCGLFLVIAGIGHSSAWAKELAYVSIAFGSYHALKSAFNSLRKGDIDVDLLMVVAAIGAIVVGEALDAAVLLFLFSLSSTMESLALARTKDAIAGLIKLRPTEARKVTESGDQLVLVEQLQLGDLIRVPAFETIPVDGVVTEGSSSVNQAAMTGESIAVTVSEGSSVIGGTQNLDGLLTMRVKSVVGDSTLDKIVALVSEAQDNQGSGERISRWFGRRYTIFVLVAFAIAFVVRQFFIREPFAEALYGSITLLVALSPCALVISTPASTLSAMAWCARSGLLVRGGEYIEKAGQIDTVALDKTGTLTTGRPTLREICVCDGDDVLSGECGRESGCWDGEDQMSPMARRLLALGFGAETYAAHPVAEAVKSAAAKFDVPTLPTSEHRVIPGQGVVATVDGETVYFGQLKMMIAEGLVLPPAFVEHVKDLQRKGFTVAVLHSKTGIAAFGFADTVMDSAAALITELRTLGVKRIVMMTGDSPETAAAVAEGLGLDEVHAGLFPADKAKIIEDLAKNGRVMMVGDGINDAPALTSASVGVAMGGLGSDIAMNAAGVVLMTDRLDRISGFIRLGRRTNGIIKANLIFASGVITCLTLSSFFFRLPLPVAVVGHEGSTVLVILNGLRLLSGPRQ